jgi:hypothetical protein
MSEHDLPHEEFERLVECWVRHAALRGNGDFWAWERVDAVVHHDPGVGWELVKALVDVAPDDLLGSVAAGPLERLVSLHGERLIAELESHARRDERFRDCLALIWLDRDAVPAEVVQRLQAVTRNRIQIVEEETD